MDGKMQFLRYLLVLQSLDETQFNYFPAFRRQEFYCSKYVFYRFRTHEVWQQGIFDIVMCRSPCLLILFFPVPLFQEIQAGIAGDDVQECFDGLRAGEFIVFLP